MRRATIALSLTLLIALVQEAPAWAAPDRTAEVAVGAPASWTTAPTNGFNVNYSANVPDNPAAPVGICTRDLQTYCETVLVKFNNPLTEKEIEDGKTIRTATGTVKVTWTRTSVPNDFDLYIFESDANGTQGAEIDNAVDDYNTVTQTTTHTIVTSVEQPSVYVFAHVVYWSVVNTGYNGSATLTGSVTT